MFWITQKYTTGVLKSKKNEKQQQRWVLGSNTLVKPWAKFWTAAQKIRFCEFSHQPHVIVIGVTMTIPVVKAATTIKAEMLRKDKESKPL